MGTQREPGQPKDKKTTSGSGRWSAYKPQLPETTVHWDEVSHGLLVECIFAVTRTGDALLLGATRDGGALVLTICSGDERVKFYAKSGEEMDSHLENIRRTAEAS